MKGRIVSLFVFALFTFCLATYVTFSAEELSKVTFKVETKSKDAKVKIETLVNMLKGVSEAEFDLNTKKLEVKFDASQIDESMLQFAIESLGYPVSKDSNEKRNEAKNTKDNSKQ